MRRRAVIALLVSLALNAFAVYAGYFSGNSSLIAEFFLMPGEFLSGFVGANTISGPYWAWALMNALFDWPLILAVLLLFPDKQSKPAPDATAS